MPRHDGHPTRGKTAPNRLRRLDLFLCEYASGLLRARDAGLVVDLGFGRVPQTTVEMAARLRETLRAPTLPFLGVEIDPERVAEARARWAMPGVDYRLGGFDLPLRAGERVRLIRALNVLRQYPEDEALPYHARMVDALTTHEGLVVEGTSCPFGRRIVVNLLRPGPDGPRLDGILFSLNFREGFSPDLFPPVLPKHLIHRHVPGEVIHAFFEDWRRAALYTRHALSYGARQHFVAAAAMLRASWPGVVLRPRWLRQGLLLWRQPPYP